MPFSSSLDNLSSLPCLWPSLTFSSRLNNLISLIQQPCMSSVLQSFRLCNHLHHQLLLRTKFSVTLTRHQPYTSGFQVPESKTVSRLRHTACLNSIPHTDSKHILSIYCIQTSTQKEKQSEETKYTQTRQYAY